MVLVTCVLLLVTQTFASIAQLVTDRMANTAAVMVFSINVRSIQNLNCVLNIFVYYL
jgi:hypothetical protein